MYVALQLSSFLRLREEKWGSGAEVPHRTGCMEVRSQGLINLTGLGCGDIISD